MSEWFDISLAAFENVVKLICDCISFFSPIALVIITKKNYCFLIAWMVQHLAFWSHIFSLVSCIHSLSCFCILKLVCCVNELGTYLSQCPAAILLTNKMSAANKISLSNDFSQIVAAQNNYPEPSTLNRKFFFCISQIFKQFPVPLKKILL